MTEQDDRLHQRTIWEEHISIVSEPESRYLDHVTPGSGKAKQIVMIGCNSTVVNTGINGGVVQLLEKSVKKPIHWFICLLDINELPLRHLFSYLDGPTTGPRAFSGTIGKALQTCDKNLVVCFEPIEAREPLRFIDVDDLSTDQKYLYAVCFAVTSGQFHDDLEYKNHRNICQARWLTLASRVLRLYASITTPDNLKTWADFLSTFTCLRGLI